MNIVEQPTISRSISDDVTIPRYDYSSFLLWVENEPSGLDGHDITRSEFIRRLMLLSYDGIYVAVENDRMSLVSYAIYNTTSLWWVLAYFNKISRPRDIAPGTVIYYPSLTAIENLYYQLRTTKTKVDTDKR